MNNSEFVFESLLRDNNFMTNIDNYITNTIFVEKSFDVKHVPQLVLLIMTLLKKSTPYIDVEQKIKNDTELKDLLDIFYTYIFKKIEEILHLIEFDKKELKKSYDICARLAVLKLKFTNKSFLGCC